MDWFPLLLSIKTALAASAVTCVLGVLAAWVVIRMKRGKSIVDAVFSLPMLLPPTVVGFFLLVLFGLNGPVGSFLKQYGIQVVFSRSGAVVAAIVVAFPLMYRTTRSAMEQLDESLIYTARTLGLSEWRIFLNIVLPNCVSGMVAGVILSFTRALGEFGATIMLAGNIPGKTQTVSTAIYTAMQTGHIDQVYRWAAVVMGISFLAILAMNFVNERQKGKTGWHYTWRSKRK